MEKTRPPARAPARAPARTPTSPAPERPTPRRAALAPGGLRKAGNQAVQRDVLDWEAQARLSSERALGPVGAPSLATVPRRTLLGPPAALEGLRLGSGQHLSPGIRHFMEARLGNDFKDVRVHTGPYASASAQAVGALAYTVGQNVFFAAGRYLPQASEGVRLLAHELAHTLQQKNGQPAPLMRQEDPNAPVCQMPSTEAAFTLPPELASYPTPGGLAVDVEVQAPSLSPGTGGRNQLNPERLTFSYPVLSETRLTFYAVPASSVTLPGEPEPVCRTPDAASLLSEAPLRSPQSREEHGITYFAWPGVTAQTPRGPVTVIAATPDHVVTTTFTELAVGAGSTGILQTGEGVVLLDAGVALSSTAVGQADAAIANATLTRLREIIGNQPIREILVTHAHLDHVALLEAISREFEIISLRLNALQLVDPRFQTVRRAVELGQQSYRSAYEAALRQSLVAGRPAWERSQPAGEFPGAREQRFNDYVEAEVQTRLAQVRPTTLEVYVPSGGRLNVVSAPIGTVGIPPGAGQDTAPLTSGSQEARRSAITDPDLPQRLDDRLRSGGKENELDRFSTSWIITLPGGNRLIVVPDLRETDFARIRSLFEAEFARLSQLTPPPQFQAWRMSHHLQSGFTDRVMDASALNRLTNFLTRFTAQEGAGGRPTADFVVISADARLIDPAQVWVLRSLGMEVFPAASGREVEILEIETSGGRRVSGVAGEAYGGARPQDLLVRRAEAAINTLGETVEGLRNQQRVTDPATPDGQRIASEIATAQTRQAAIREALTDYTQQVRQEIGRSSGRTNLRQPAPPPSPAQGAAEPATTQAQALRTALQGFDQPVVGETPRFTETALVIVGRRRLDQVSGAQREILQRRLRLAELRQQLPESPVPHQVLTEMLTRLNELQNLLEAERTTAPEGTRQLIEDELASTRRQVESLTTVPESEISRGRVPGSGEITETRVISVQRVRPETAFSRGVQKFSAGTGRVLGGLMVITTIQSQVGLESRLAAGRATGLEALAGTAHNALGVTAGIRMAAGMHVPGGAFVILSALDFAQTAARSYTTDVERDIALGQSAIRNSISLAVMGLGQLMMKAPNPWVQLAGLGIMVAVDPILNALGFYEWTGDLLEQTFELNPSEVTETAQDLRRLMAEYRRITGAMELERRDASELNALGAPNPEAVRRQAQAALREHRQEAREKETEILETFEDAYQRARTSYAGLRDLDNLRVQFITLQNSMNPSTERTPQDEARRTLIETTFQSIERSLSLDTLTAGQISRLEQWRGIDDKLTELHWEIFHEDLEDIDWDDVRDLIREASLMLQNARYRLDPVAQGGPRPAGLLSLGSEARRAYEAELEPRQRRLEHMMVLLGGALSGQQIERHPVGPGLQPVLLEEAVPAQVSPDEALRHAERSLQVFQSLLNNQPALPPELSVQTIYSHSISAGSSYRTYVDYNTAFRSGLERLQLAEDSMNTLIASAAQAVLVIGPPTAEHQALLTDLRQQSRLASERRRLNGFLYLAEAQALSGQIREFEIAELARALGEQPGAVQLSPSEVSALETDEMEDSREQLSTLRSRLAQVPELGRGRSGEVMEGLNRFEGEWNASDGLRRATASDNILVGNLDNSLEVVTLGGHHYEVQIVPINDAAVDFFQGLGVHRVPSYYLRSLRLEELQP